jgi:hypothetical protein
MTDGAPSPTAQDWADKTEQAVLDQALLLFAARGYDGVGCTPDGVLARLLPDLRPGAIVLLHEGAAHGHNQRCLGLGTPVWLR